VRDLVLEILVAIGLVLLGMLAVYLIAGDRAWSIDGDLAYAIGALVFSVPAILILERRRRRKL